MRSPSTYRREFLFLTASRLIMNVAVRFVYMFLGPIARGLMVTDKTLGQSTVLLNLSGLIAPAAGRTGDHRGRHFVMAIGALMTGLGAIISGSTSTLVVFAVGLGVIGMGVIAFATSMTAWVGDEVPYERRGFAIGVTEMSWAAALFIGMPLVAISMDVWSWRAPFFIIAIAMVPVSARIWMSHSQDMAHAQPAAQKFKLTSQALLLFLAMTIISIGHQLIIVSHGVWLEQELGFDISGLGAVAIPLGIGEMLGAGATLIFPDRIGKANSAIIGFLLCVPFALAIGPLGETRLSAILLLAGFLMTFEFGFVAAIPLFTELGEGSRGAALGIVAMCITASRALATIVGASIFDSYGMSWVSLASGLTMVTGALLVWRAGDPGAQRLASQGTDSIPETVNDRGQSE